MNKSWVLPSIFAACVLEPPPSDDSTWYTLCDGCFSTETTPPSAGAVHLVRLTTGVPSDVTAGAGWAGTEGEQLGSALVTVGDLDDDGLWDLSALRSGPGILRTSDAPGVRFARIEAEPRPVGDLDGDGRLDLALSHSQADTSSVLPGAELAAGGTFVLGDGWPVVPELAFG